MLVVEKTILALWERCIRQIPFRDRWALPVIMPHLLRRTGMMADHTCPKPATLPSLSARCLFLTGTAGEALAIMARLM